MNPDKLTTDKRIEVTKLDVVKEEAIVTKVPVVSGTVNITRTTETTPKEVNWTETQYTVRQERHPINQVVDEAPPVRTEGDTIIVPVLREEAVVVKRLVLVEEIHYVRERTEAVRSEDVNLRQHRVNVNRS